MYEQAESVVWRAANPYIAAFLLIAFPGANLRFRAVEGISSNPFFDLLIELPDGKTKVSVQKALASYNDGTATVPVKQFCVCLGQIHRDLRVARTDARV